MKADSPEWVSTLQSETSAHLNGMLWMGRLAGERRERRARKADGNPHRSGLGASWPPSLPSQWKRKRPRSGVWPGSLLRCPGSVLGRQRHLPAEGPSSSRGRRPGLGSVDSWSTALGIHRPIVAGPSSCIHGQPAPDAALLGCDCILCRGGRGAGAGRGLGRAEFPKASKRAGQGVDDAYDQLIGLPSASAHLHPVRLTVIRLIQITCGTWFSCRHNRPLAHLKGPRQFPWPQ